MGQDAADPSQSHDSESFSQLSPPDPKQSDAPSHTNPSISAYTQSSLSEAQQAQMNDPHPHPSHAHAAPLPSLPSEIRALIDAYVAGMPVVIVASRSRIAELFMGGARDGESGQKNLQKSGFGVPPKECGFGWLGLFRILGLEEKRVAVGSTVRKDRAMASAVACVQWRFRVEWMPGGEGIFKENAAIGLDLSRPWWSIPPPPSGSGVVGMASVAAASASAVSRGLRSSSALGPRLSAVAAGKQPERRGLDSPSVHLGSASESVSEKIGIETTTPELYLHARQVHPSYRSGPGTELYASLLPQPLLAEFNSFISNDVFPSGWFCAAGGKVNFQVAMRHRKCQSMKCLQDTKPATTYAQDLADIRGPHSYSPCCLPFNDCSDSVLGTSTSWNNGMRTLSYYYGLGAKPRVSAPAEAQPEEERKVWIKHVFTCNLAHLQKVASEMIHVLQMEVELRRKVEDVSNPFFECAYDLSPSVGAAVPDCLVKAGELLAKRVSAYAEIGVEAMEVSKLKVLAWMAPGKWMNQDVLRAKSSPVAVLCLGSDVVMCLSPQKAPEARKAPGSSKKGPTKNSASKKGKEVEPPQLDLSSLIVMDESSTMKEEEKSDGAQTETLNVASSSRPPAVTPVNKLAEGTVQVTMDFTTDGVVYSLKRSGTGIRKSGILILAFHSMLNSLLQ
ncbi:hypothetical protein DFP72DRAFT_906140 [Ephemerocybe angulata]|uniref:Uncharacterized protein n=1 Tax=Ephemerocybe angulata TaxID=980116 RepID=A0A8H6HS13_9AGAR|nr:hypothetical protein DFP72DRAFT_906140 [Tulosesus angulatus]